MTPFDCPPYCTVETYKKYVSAVQCCVDVRGDVDAQEKALDQAVDAWKECLLESDRLERAVRL